MILQKVDDKVLRNIFSPRAGTKDSSIRIPGYTIKVSFIVLLSAIGSGICFLLTGYFLFLAARNEPKITVERQQFAEINDFTLTRADRTLMRYWRRGPLHYVHPDRIINVASGKYQGEQTLVCDIRGQFTVVAIYRAKASSVVVDIRSAYESLPSEPDMELIAAIGDHVLFSNNSAVAQRITDRRLIAFSSELIPTIKVIWSEGAWSIAAIPLDTTYEETQKVVSLVRRFSDLMKVLPPRPSKHRSGALVS